MWGPVFLMRHALSQSSEVSQGRVRHLSPLMLTLEPAKRREQSQKWRLASAHTQKALDK